MRELKNKCPNCGRLFDKKEDQVVEKQLLLSDSPQPPADSIPEPHIQVEKICIRCKSSVLESASYCSNCGSSLKNEYNPSNKTFNPWAQSDPIQIAKPIQVPACSLSFLSGDGEPLTDSVLRFAGDVIQLNRSNTEPVNPTITSQVQAELSYEDNKWYIQDKSALKTTYIYAGEKKEIKQGDQIVLGNRAFVFNCED
jgi:RNA polymerase subunit RPABC4/transcription elongation factor Spt4